MLSRCELSNPVEVIDRADIDCPRITDYKERQKAGTSVVCNRQLQG
jgi:hypothetical protein